ncbi:unnamed protein product [Blumeria hordei]|uniref:Proline dehydrogenase n=2 Tax=Blumeria hordei TaxID=2867405 RepID=A0A383ULZ9_BLUHO|nr:hypothetical protein BGHDH14_bgh00160 [Blumeria hordei DH14]SZF01333.1 unnamed protein product [Blumeria hordei]
MILIKKPSSIPIATILLSPRTAAAHVSGYGTLHGRVFSSKCAGGIWAERQAAFSSSTISKPAREVPPTPLSILPLSTIIRSIALKSIFSSRFLLPPCLAITSFIANTSLRLFSPESNPLVHILFKSFFYKHFCAGETLPEVRKTTDTLRSIGYSGVVLAYAKETALDEKTSDSYTTSDFISKASKEEINRWTKGTLDTIALTVPGDFIALKLTGAGSHALSLLSRSLPPSTEIQEAISEICNTARQNNVCLLIDAEHSNIQKSIHDWSIRWMEQFNTTNNGRAVIYNTYQAYLKETPLLLTEHLTIAGRKNFVLGVKLVRGAYLDSEPRHIIHDTKEETDKAYDKIAVNLVQCQYWAPKPFHSAEAEFPDVCVMLATHNLISIRKVQAIREVRKERRDKNVDLVYAQLQGMADEIGCELILSRGVTLGKEETDLTQAYVYLVWGTVGECMKYLLRRADENRDALQRKDGKVEEWKELRRRLGIK